ncbi:hypothetical protein [Streptomyces lonarensis]|uniref:Uncharacterized protein n=1 Tax=Streptomyces lonarensis TaxID=700599 RepID=A0A7X6CYP9_9ACTN|nr:hypothetical protein [Streptomyces lonarensis]NJQ04864.1 hypothetical protein [Streptomyces lonarensis]
MAATNALTAREAAAKAAHAKDEADTAAREAAAVVLRLFDNDAELVAELLGVPAEELEREAKPVTAARAKEIIEELRVRSERPHAVRRRRPRTDGAETPPPPTGDSAPMGVADVSRPDAG